MIRCRKCGITYKDTATMCLRCFNPLPKPSGKVPVRKPVRKEVLDRIKVGKRSSNIPIATATPLPRKIANRLKGDNASPSSEDTGEVSTVLTVNKKETLASLPAKEVSNVSAIENTLSHHEVTAETTIPEISTTKESLPNHYFSKEELLSEKDTVVVVSYKDTFKQELSDLMDAIKEFEPDKIIGDIYSQFGDIRVDEIEKLFGVIKDLEHPESIYVKNQHQITFNRGYMLQSGYITQLNLSNLGLSVLPNNLETLQKLSALDLERNNFETFPDGLNKLSNLESLNISENKIKVFPNSVGILTNLTSLWLYDNEITELPTKLYLLTNLELLDLRGNNLASSNLDVIYELKKLKYLSLESNNIKSISEKLDTLIELETLLLGDNPIDKFPDISNLKNLKELSLYGTKLTYVPESILFLPNLRYLDIWNTPIKPNDWILMELQDVGVNIKTESV